jgi:tRNA (mo5U34)-methyltransferase
MVGAGADLVIGLDPFLLYVMQFWAMYHFAPAYPLTVLPLGIESLPPNLRAFDTVFSMGVLYHRKDPFEHLHALQTAVRPGGELVLETLVIEGETGEVLVPHGRYAQMRNVHALPSVGSLTSWLKQCHYTNIQVVDVSQTTIEEQRSTDWMTFHSLPDFLDPQDPSKTVEGYPAPKRAIVTAVSP